MLQNLNFEGLIPILGGIAGLFISYGPIHLNENRTLSLIEKLQNNRRLKLICPLVIIFGLLQLFNFMG